MYQRASAGGGGSDWYNVILLTTAPGAAITITDGDEEIEATGTGSQQAIAIHDESATYTISVVVNGFTKPGTNVSTGTTSGIIFEREVAFAEVTLTYDDDFRSQSGTISDGTTTANYTFPASDNEATIYIPSTGTWNVYCTVSGEQYKSSDIVVTSLSDSYTSDIHVRPDGKTVTPTDDIQTWLECGGIKGKSYTTLDEVLADHETLQKLIIDENAVDYMVRSKKFINAELISPLSSDDNKTSESTNHDLSVPYKTFDGDWTKSALYTNQSGWLASAGSSTNQWLARDFDVPVNVSGIKMRAGCENVGGGGTIGGIGVKDFKIQYSDVGGNNDADWSDAGSFTYVGTNGTAPTAQEFVLSNNVGLHRYWRIYVIDNYKSGLPAGIANLQFYLADHGITEDETAMRYIGKRNYAADTLLADSNPGLVPAMTDNTHPSGEAIRINGYGTEAANFSAYCSFNRDNTDGACVNNDGIIAYHFNSAVKVKGYKIFTINNTNTPSTVQLVASHNGTDWTNIGTAESTPNQSTEYIFENSSDDTAYEYWGIKGFGGPLGYWRIAEIQFYAKSLFEPQWLDGILDSNYMGSVLNITVPKMTANNAPEGLTFAYQQDNAQYSKAYNGFDGDVSTSWTNRYGSATSVSDFIGYMFTSAKRIIGLMIDGVNSASTNTNPTTYTLQGSNDTTTGKDGTWTDIEDFVLPDMYQSSSGYDVGKVMLSTPVTYSAYRVKVKSLVTSPAQYWYVNELQFFGREDVDETKIDIYTATNDTVYKEVSGSPVTLGTISDNGNVLRVARTDLPVGTHKLGSTIAKDPDDLTADYTKDVNIFDGMIEIMLMPDNVLYWYGYEKDIEDVTTANGWSSSNYTLVAPTHGINKITCTNNAMNQMHAFSSSKKGYPGTTKVHIIYKGLAAYQNVYGFIMASKSAKNNYAARKNLLNNVMTHDSGVLGSGYDDCYIGFGVWYNSVFSMEVYAVWTEES